MIDRADGFRGRVFPVIPTPFDDKGRVHRRGLERLVESLTTHPIGGLAVWTPIGRGVSMTDDQRLEVLRIARDWLEPDQRLIVGVGAADSVRRPDQVIESARRMADQAVGLGADLLLALPPGSFRGRPDRDRLVLEYHVEIAGAGRPILASYRRESVGGISYGPEVLAQLMARTEVLGVEVATIDAITTFQQIVRLVKVQAPDKLIVSGEERFAGYSLMSGADSLMLGLASAYPAESVGLIEAHLRPDPARFLEQAAKLDEVSAPIFRAPSDGTPLRLLQTLVQLGFLPADAANDLPPVSRPV